MGHAELTDQPGQQAVDDLRRTHDAEAAHLVEVDDERRPTDEGVASRRAFDPSDACGQLAGAQPDAPGRAAPQSGSTLLGRGQHPGRVGMDPVQALSLTAQGGGQAAAGQPDLPLVARQGTSVLATGANAVTERAGQQRDGAERRKEQEPRSQEEGQGDGNRHRSQGCDPRHPGAVLVREALQGRRSRASSTTGACEAVGVMRTVPSPGQRIGGPTPAARDRRNVVEPTTTVDRTSIAVTPSARTPSTTTPLVDPQSATVTPFDPTATVTCRRLSASSWTGRPHPGARPTVTPGGRSGCLRPASGPPTTTRSRTPAASTGGGVTGRLTCGATDTDAPGGVAASRRRCPAEPAARSRSATAPAPRGGRQVRRTARRRSGAPTTRRRRRPVGGAVAAGARSWSSPWRPP